MSGILGISDQRGSLGTLLVGSILGGAAAAGMFLWQRSVEIAGSTYVIVGYTCGYWYYLKTSCAWSLEMLRDLKRQEINRLPRRYSRLAHSIPFWLSVVIGCLIIVASAWYAGMKDVYGLTWVASGWLIIAVLLNFEMTVLFPTTNCRKCKYALLGQIDPEDPEQIVQCPECGSKWSKQDLFLNVQAPRPAGSASRPQAHRRPFTTA